MKMMRFYLRGNKPMVTSADVPWHEVIGMEGGNLMLKVLAVCLLVLTALFHPPLIHALPAKDVQVVLDREYFQITRALLRDAEKSIRVMMFEANFYTKHPQSPSNILIGELISARKRGLRVEVILEASDRGDRATERNRATGEMLSREGIEVIYDPLFVTTHAKLIIIDERICLLGSTNWTYHSLTSNHEVGVLIESEEVARTLGHYFDRVKTSGHRE